MTQFAHTTARIAAWNLAGFEATTPERRARQVHGLALMDAEVVALVEVNPVTAIDELKAGLAARGVTCQSRILPQNGSLHIGVLFKEGVEVIEEPVLLEGTDLGLPDRRRAFQIKLKIGQFDFILIIVHLKSGRSAGDQTLRDEQAKKIGDHITALRAASNEDILLVGDFNMIPGQDVSNFHHLGGADLMDFLSSWDLQDRYTHILPKGRQNLLDGFAISRTFSGEYIPGSLRVFPMHWAMKIGESEFRDTVSDHLPFVASFRIDRHSGG